MIDMIDELSKAQLYTVDRILLGEAVLSGISPDDNEVFLIVSYDIMEQLYTSLIITFSNDAYGLISYKAELVSFRRESEEDQTYEIKCALLEKMEVIQRRENFKIKTSIPVTVGVYSGSMEPILDKTGNQVRYEAEIKDISASGVLLSTDQELTVGQVVDFTFEQTTPALILEAELIRHRTYKNGINEYGCRFIRLNAEKESGIRRYVFQIQLSKAQSR